MHQESQEIQDDVWDCTLIKEMKNNNDTIVNPIYKWLDTDIWEYIKQENIKVNPLYSNGYDRVGCIGCPLASYHKRIKEFNDYPQYKQLYINAFERMIEERKKRNMKVVWKTGQEVFDWWIEEGKHNCKGQMNIYDYIGEREE